MKIALVGSSKLDMKLTAGPLLREMVKLPTGTVVLLRRPANRSEHTGNFEKVAATLCETLHMEPVWYEPDIAEYDGRAATYERDIRMARDAERVIAFFPKDLVMTGGTGHVVEKFHDANKPSECYGVDEIGAYQWVGGMEPAL